MTIVYFVIALGILIFIHELGHFILAKRQGVCVEAFSLGFGPRLFGFKKGETDYRISLLPLGGYVKMRGEDPSDEKASDPRSFSAKSVWSRFKIVLFGPLMNLFLCLAIMPVVFMIGRMEPTFLKEQPAVMGVRANSPAALAGLEKGDLITAIDGSKVGTWEEALNRFMLEPKNTLELGIDRDGQKLTQKIIVGEMPELKGGYVGIEPMLFYGNEATVDAVRKGGPADKAGLKAGDKVLSLGGTQITDWLDLSEKIDKSGNAPVELTIERNGKSETVNVTPEYDKEFGRWLIGISKDRRSGVPMHKVQYGFFESIVKGTQENIKLAGLTFNVLGKLVTLKLSYKVLGGPIIIAKTSAAAAASGLSNFIYFVAFLSMQLAILNVLPIPVLDGGHLLFLGIEAIRRKQVSLKVRAYADQIGFVILIALMLLVTYNDIENIWGIKTLLKKIF